MFEDLRRLGPMHATYPNNSTFWATLEVAAVHLEHRAATPPGPLMWDALIGAVEVHPQRNAGPTAADPFGLNAPTFDDLWHAQRDYFAQKRGFDQPDPPPGFGMKGLKIPRTTNQDVLEVSAYWSGQLAKAREVTGYKTAVDKWNAVLADIDRLAKTGKPEDVYLKNNEFWRTLNDISIQIAIGDEAPTKWDLAKESVKDSATHLPSTLYTHLEKLLVAPATPGKTGERVRAGQAIGIIGASPLDGEHLKHLHFEVWLGGPNDRIDPSPLMRGCDTVPELRPKNEIEFLSQKTINNCLTVLRRMPGAPLKAIQELLGHATIQMTMRYAHLAPEVARDAVRLLDANEVRGKTVAKNAESAAN